MDHEAAPLDAAPDPESPPALVDVNGLTLLELLQAKDPRMERSVRLLVEEQHHRPDILLGWSSTANQLRPHETTSVDGYHAWPEVDNDNDNDDAARLA